MGALSSQSVSTSPVHLQFFSSSILSFSFSPYLRLYSSSLPYSPINSHHFQEHISPQAFFDIKIANLFHKWRGEITLSSLSLSLSLFCPSLLNRLLPFSGAYISSLVPTLFHKWRETSPSFKGTTQLEEICWEKTSYQTGSRELTSWTSLLVPVLEAIFKIYITVSNNI